MLVKPNGSNSEILPIANSLTHYTSSVLFNSTELRDSGEYICIVNIENEINTSVRKVVTVGKSQVNKDSRIKSERNSHV